MIEINICTYKWGKFPRFTAASIYFRIMIYRIISINTLSTRHEAWWLFTLAIVDMLIIL